MSKLNVLLVIVDCLRYDRVTQNYMPNLYRWGKSHISYSNFWANSHCTDPSITCMLSGRHPDDLRLYSMMYGKKNYMIPDDVEMLSQYARKRGYRTGFLTNLGRWYKRGVDEFVNVRGWPGKRTFTLARRMARETEKPWFIVVHTDDAHANYTGGSYDAAVAAVDQYLSPLLSMTEDTAIFVTSDHGEGLGQSGPDGHPIQQHGYGLWPFLTHVPLVTNFSPICGALAHNPIPGKVDLLADDATLYWMMKCAISGEYIEDYQVPTMVFQAGATPKVFHRGVVLEDKRRFVRATPKEGKAARFYSGKFNDEEKGAIELHLERHCKKYGIEYGDLSAEAKVIDRLVGLGYWDA